MGGWSWLYEGGRYLGCCWNLVAPTDNYSALSLPFTTAVAAYLWIGLDSTHKSPHTHVGTDAGVQFLPRRLFLAEHREELLHCSLKALCFDHSSGSLKGLRSQVLLTGKVK